VRPRSLTSGLVSVMCIIQNAFVHFRTIGVLRQLGIKECEKTRMFNNFIFKLTKIACLFAFWVLPPTFQTQANCKSSDVINSIAFSPNEKYVAAVWNRNTVQLWETHTGKRVQSFSLNNTDFLNVVFSHNGNLLLAGTPEGAVLWNVETAALIRTFQRTVPNQFGRIGSTVFFDKSDQYVLTGGSEGAALWRIEDGAKLRIFSGNMDMQSSKVQLSPSGDYLLTSDNGWRLWEVQSGKLVFSFPDSNPSGTAGFSLNGKWIVTDDYTHGFVIWNAQSHTILYTLDSQVGHRYWKFSPDSRFVGAIADIAGNEPVFVMWDVATGRQLKNLAIDTNVFSFEFVQDRLLIVKPVIQGEPLLAVNVWNLESQKTVKQFTISQGDDILSRFSALGEYWLTTDSEQLFLRESDTGKEISRFC
jgi:WD40 repeat protein